MQLLYYSIVNHFDHDLRPGALTGVPLRYGMASQESILVRANTLVAEPGFTKRLSIKFYSVLYFHRFTRIMLKLHRYCILLVCTVKK